MGELLADRDPVTFQRRKDSLILRETPTVPGSGQLVQGPRWRSRWSTAANCAERHAILAPPSRSPTGQLEALTGLVSTNPLFGVVALWRLLLRARIKGPAAKARFGIPRVAIEGPTDGSSRSGGTDGRFSALYARGPCPGFTVARAATTDGH